MLHPYFGGNGDTASSQLEPEIIIPTSSFVAHPYTSRIFRDLPSMSTNSSNCPGNRPFGKSRWFTRGWTLQELLAPGSVEFFSENWEQLGDMKSLERHIHEIICQSPPRSPLSNFSATERLLWAEKRDTTREETRCTRF
ncbi:hypothetical protein BGZ57DRAFT_987310 [Hyaloscypha finlandica]|nr:hypothetical protein BGZ57DRAFT_987310 [Hyaloscypha finlandica]